MVMRSTKARSFRTTLSTLETQLDPAIFFRIGKSCIVNFNYVDELEFDQIKIGNEFLSTSKVYRSYEEMLEAFTSYLQAVGFYVDPNTVLDFVEED
jgi:DNA-binding LytR/AlgR family response regulator